jgi:acyl-CoA reductase-like NAD-dependent aldehyde dehydrogenase
MTVLYSPSVGSFFVQAIHGNDIPSDVVEITAEEHAALFAAQAAGQVIRPGEGGKPEAVTPPAPPSGPPPVPASITARQARLALLQAGLLDQVDAAVAAADRAAQLEWEYATTIDRGSALVQGLAANVPLTDAQLDALFTVAAAL